ncbi:DeoR/GlpR family DNA-binding transcription regulator [Streptosporangium sp. NPDC051022]|uniref:DeoR/GlpR family DNA-binding transcription regulator n=1 Tax=Streptosporangium sp. NPDC051022 TaxID=3155752 RepID=UPI00341CF1C6
MLAQQRQQVIVERVRGSGGVRVADLVREFGVSDMTIRRDLEALAERGLIEKVHGGATATGLGPAEESGFTAGPVRRRAEKEAIARHAAGLVRPGTAVALSAGTTTWTLAHLLVEVPELTVITNSIRVADVFHRSPRADRTVVLTGGVRTPSDALVGPIAVAAVRGLHVDTLFLGVHGMSVRAGFTTPDLLEAEIDRGLIASARRLVVPADHTKWGTVGISTIAGLAEAHLVITDSGLAEEAREEIAARVGELIVAEPHRESGTAER